MRSEYSVLNIVVKFSFSSSICPIRKDRNSSDTRRSACESRALVFLSTATAHSKRAASSIEKRKKTKVFVFHSDGTVPSGATAHRRPPVFDPQPKPPDAELNRVDRHGAARSAALI